MTRRLLGPIGGPIVFFLVVALVFSGLAWVSYSALQVEQAQREGAASADHGKTLRVALWRLDGSVVRTLGVEDTRPYFHYAPPDPAATPLLAVSLPDWMKLHFQLDPTEGWCSPQVLPPETADQVRQAWAEVPTQNLTVFRCSALNELKERFPAQDTFAALSAAYRAMPDEYATPAGPPPGGVAVNSPVHGPMGIPSLSPTAPPTPMIPPPALGPTSNALSPIENTPNGDAFSLFGWELCLQNDRLTTNNTLSQKGGDGGQSGAGPWANSQAPGVQARGGRMGLNQPGRGGAPQSSYPEAQKRGDILDRSQREAKQAAELLLPKGQLQNYGQGYDPRVQGNLYNPSATINSKLAGNGTIPPSGPGAGNNPGIPAAPGTMPSTTVPDNDARSRRVKDAQAPMNPASESKKGSFDPDQLKKLWDKSHGKAVESRGWFARLGNERVRQLLGESQSRGRGLPDVPKLAEEPHGAPVTTPTAPTALPTPDAINPWVPTPPLAIHLGSMRPQWVTAPDGSEMLVLVRAAKVDSKTVYQGVVLDWVKLEATLKDAVRDLFPDAKLTPIKDLAAASPDRTMISLPVQLDPGPEQPPSPAGWTTLRIGLLLGWVAAIIALAAVGFAGWSLIDLAERRIRFVSAVTHELRTPLTSLRLYLDLLVSGMIQDETKRQEYLKTLAIESDRLHRLIDNVLDFAKLEKRKKNGDIKPAKIADLLDLMRQTWADRVAMDGKELVVRTTLPPEREVSTDAAMIQQIVGNLIDNARKYTRDVADNRIWLSAKPGTGSAVFLEVEDRGAGVQASERKSIFKPFRRGDHADGKAGGAGLGLALAKSWAEVLGARLTYSPADGGTGACFRLELPGN